MTKIFLDSLVFQVRYAFGYTYLDRCGQTLVDIERDLDGWVTTDVSPAGGLMHNPDANMKLEFHSEAFTLTARKPKPDTVGEHAKNLWKIVRRNLGLQDLVRVAGRFNYLLPKKDTDSAEKALKKSEFNLIFPDRIADGGYTLKVRHMIAVLERERIEYRVELKGITRTESVPPSPLLSTPPKLLPEGQRNARLALLKRRADYEKNPTHAVLLDVDCVEYEPNSDVQPAVYVSETSGVVEADFLPLLVGIE